MMDILKEWVGLASLLVANAGVNVGIYKYFNSRLDRVYARLDEVKEGVESRYVRKDNCALLHSNTADNLKGMEIRVDIRFDKLEKRIEE